jgi:hypothetical protein
MYASIPIEDVKINQKFFDALRVSHMNQPEVPSFFGKALRKAFIEDKITS